MNTIIVGFSRAKSAWAVGSKAIQAVEKRNFSHVYIKYQCSLTGQLIVAQASKGFIHEMTWDNFLEHNICVKEYSVDCSDFSYKLALTFVRENLGVPYSYTQLFWIGLKKLFKVKITYNNRDNAYICSEFAARVCGMLGVGVGSIENLDTFTPSDMNELMLKFLKEHPQAVRISYE